MFLPRDNRIPWFLKSAIALVIVTSFLVGSVPFFGSSDIYHRTDARNCTLNEIEEDPLLNAENQGRNVDTFTTGMDTFLCNSYEYLNYDHENKNFGGDPSIYLAYDATKEETEAGHFFPFRGMIKFDISGIPTDTIIVSARMKLYYADAEEGAAVPLTVSAYPMTRSWTEGSGTWEEDIHDGATWFTFDGERPWNTPGGDYDDQKTVQTATPAGYGWVTWDIQPFVEDWVQGGIENHGVMLISHSVPSSRSLKYFNSFGSAENKPILEISYNKPPAAFIDSVQPNPVKEYRNVTFTGHGEDPDDGNTNSGFMWMVKTEYIPTIIVGTEAVTRVNNLTRGSYTVSFRVQDSFGAWSPEVSLGEPLIVTADEPPGRINDLVAEPHGGMSGAINLSWDAVAEDGSDEDGDATRYIIKYSSSFMDSEVAFETAEELGKKDVEGDIPEPRKPGGREKLVVTELTKGKEYFFGIIVLDERGQRSPLSNVPRAIAPDHNPPALISDLSAEPGVEDGEIDLVWTATGNDGNDGQAARYVIKYSEDKIRSIWDYHSADEVPNSHEIPLPRPPSSREEFTVTGLMRRTTYYFAIRAFDEWGNDGPMSNVASAMATDRTPPPMIKGVYAMDTPEDNGKSITVSWNPVKVDDFNHYDIYVTTSVISDVYSLVQDGTAPVKTIEDMKVGSTIIISDDKISLVDRREYYVAVVAVDDYGNAETSVVCFGPTMSLNNLKKAQPLIDPEEGETYEGKLLSENRGVDIEVTGRKITIATEEIDDDTVRVTTGYEIEGKVSVIGDEVERIDIYDRMKDEEDEWIWVPIMDHDSAEFLDETDADYLYEWYELFINPDLSGDIWSITTEYSRIVEKSDLERMGLGEEMEGEAYEHEICIVAWTVTAEWNYMVMEYAPIIDSQWLDSDNDHLPDNWEEKYFNDIGSYNAGDDPDGDGYSNLVEYQMGKHPNDKSDQPQGMDRDVGKSSTDKKSGGVIQWWLPWAVLFILLIGGLIIAVVVISKRSIARDRTEPVKFEISPEGEAAAASEKPCPKCAGPLTFVFEYKQWYCHSCQEYAPLEGEAPSEEIPAAATVEERIQYDHDCETCGKPLEYDSLTGSWLCDTCDAIPPEFMGFEDGDAVYGYEETPVPALPAHLEGATEIERPPVPALPAHLEAGTGSLTPEGEKTLGDYEEMRSMLEKAPSYIDVTKPLETLERARSELESGEIEKADASIQESKEMANGIRERYGQLVAKSEAISNELQEMTRSALDTTKLQELFIKGKESLMGGDFDVCEGLFDDALAEVENEKTKGGGTEAAEAGPDMKAGAEQDVIPAGEDGDTTTGRTDEAEKEETEDTPASKETEEPASETSKEDAEALPEQTEQKEPETPQESEPGADEEEQAKEETSLDDDLADIEGLLGM